jgi:hypothetical protein
MAAAPSAAHFSRARPLSASTAVRDSSRFLHVVHNKSCPSSLPYRTWRWLMAASANALLHVVSVASDAAASFGARPASRRPRLARPTTKEESMQMLSITDLMRLTRTELCQLLTQTVNALPELPEGSPERDTTVMNMSNIRWAMARRGLAP